MALKLADWKIMINFVCENDCRLKQQLQFARIRGAQIKQALKIQLRSNIQFTIRT